AVLDWAVMHAEKSSDGARPLSGPDPAELGLRLAGAMPGFWDKRSYRSEEYTRLSRLVSLEGNQARTAGRGEALQTLGNLAGWLGSLREGRLALEECLSIRRELGDPRALASAVTALGQTAFFQGDYEVARTFLTDGLSISRELKDEPGIADALDCLGRV